MTPYLLLNYLNIPKVPIHSTWFSQYIGDVNFYKNFSFIQFQRSATEKHLQIHRNFRKKIQTQHKIPLVYEIDDLLMDIPEWNFVHFYYKDNVHHIETMMRESDAIVVSTHPLRKVYEKYNKNVKVMPNHLAKFIWGDIEPKHDRYKGEKIRILWAGSQNHFKHPSMKSSTDGGDFGKLLMNFIRKTVDEYEWVFMGATPMELDDIKDKFEFHEWKNTFEYPRYLKGLNADIGIAPLQKGLFNDCKCIVGNSLVPIKYGIKTIKEIYAEKYDKLHYNTFITDHIKYKKQNTIKITTKNGYQLEGTYTHRIKDNNLSWKRLDLFDIGDNVAISKFDILQKEYQYLTFPMLLTKSIDNDIFENSVEDMLPRIVINERWGRLLGYLIGDGYYNSGNSVSISCDRRYPDVVDDVHDLFRSIGLRTHEVLKTNHHSKDNHITRPYGVDVKASSRNLRLLLEKSGFTGRYGKVLEVPNVILNSPKSVIKEFLRGLFEADGIVNVHHSNCSLSTKSDILAKQVHFLLLGFGIKCKVGKNLNKKYQKYYWTVYLGREATDKFYEEIGFFSDRKNSKLRQIHQKKHSNRFKKDDWTDEIINIEYGVNDVYDIEVAVTHEYISNGFYNHNSNIKALEFTASGIPGIYSKVAPYNTMSTRCDTEEEMIDKIREFAENVELRKKVWLSDYNTLKGQLWWEEDDNLRKYVNTYLGLMNRKLPN